MHFNDDCLHIPVATDIAVFISRIQLETELSPLALQHPIFYFLRTLSCFLPLSLSPFNPFHHFEPLEKLQHWHLKGNLFNWRKCDKIEKRFSAFYFFSAGFLRCQYWLWILRFKAFKGNDENVRNLNDFHSRLLFSFLDTEQQRINFNCRSLKLDQFASSLSLHRQRCWRLLMRNSVKIKFSFLYVRVREKLELQIVLFSDGNNGGNREWARSLTGERECFIFITSCSKRALEKNVVQYLRFAIT